MKIVTQTEDVLIVDEAYAVMSIVGACFALFSIFFSLLVPKAAVAMMCIGLPVGLVLVFLNASTRLEFQKSTNSFVCRVSRLVGQKVTTYAISDVLKLQTRRIWKVRATPGGRTSIVLPERALTVQSFLILKNGVEIPITHDPSAPRVSVGPVTTPIGQIKEDEAVKIIATFLGVPHEEVGDDDSATLLGIPLGGVNAE